MIEHGYCYSKANASWFQYFGKTALDLIKSNQTPDPLTVWKQHCRAKQYIGGGGVVYKYINSYQNSHQLKWPFDKISNYDDVELLVKLHNLHPI